MKKQREHWGSQLGFIMAAAGSAIGLGTLWMFPYVTGKNGGGLFVLLYFAFTFVVGLPVFIAELTLGRHAQQGAVGTFTSFSGKHTPWKIIGWLGVAASFIIMSYYSVVAGWGLNYVLMSLNQFWEHQTAEGIGEVFNILDRSGDISLFWHFVFTGITAMVVYQGIRKGIEYWGRVMTSSLLVLLLCLFIYSTQLSGFSEALHFIFYPDFSKFKPSGALEALGLAFLTLSLGQGIMLTYGSYMKKTDNLPKTAAIIGCMDIVVALLASMMIFPIIFTFSDSTSVEAGPGLVFKTLPIIFAQLPGALVISTTFFVLLVFTALTSAVALIEVVAANFIDLFAWSRRKAVIVVSCSTAIFGIPSALSGSKGIFPNWETIYGISFFDTMNALVTVWLLPIGGLLIAIYTGWVVDKKVLRKAFGEGTTSLWLFHPWRFLLRWVVPSAVMLVILYKSGIIDVDYFVK